MGAKARTVSLIIAGLFALAVVFRFMQQMLPSFDKDDSYPGIAFAVDGPVYFLPLYHVLAVIGLLILLLTKRVWITISFYFSYFLLHLYGFSIRSQGCFMGGDICPERPVLDKLLERLDLVDWIAIPVLSILIVVHAIAIFRKAENN